MLPILSAGTKINDLLGRLGIPGGLIGAQVDMLSGNPLGVLQNLRDAYQEAALGRGTNGLERALGGASPFSPAGFMPAPGQILPQLAPLCGAGYCGGLQTIDLAGGRPNNFLSRILDPQRSAATKLESLLKENPAARAAFEQAVGGRIVGFGRDDGKMTIQRFAPGLAPLPGFGLSPLASPALQAFSSLSQGVLGAAGRIGLGAASAGLLAANPFLGIASLGLGRVAGGMLGGGLPFGFGLGGALGGGGVGSWNPNAQPGHINGTNPLVERAHQAQVNGVLNDPSLSVEDKVTLMLMLIMKKMDKDIEKQMEYVNSLQNQQGNRGGGKKGGKGGGLIPGKKGGGGGKKGGGNGESSPSIDVETTKMKRMIDKRGQMFDMLRQIIDKYNETAKGMIQSIGR